MDFRRSLAWAWTFVILALCWYPRAMMRVEENGIRPFLFPHFDKVVHGGIFVVFAVLWMRARQPVVRVLLGGVALAIVSEIGQEIPFVHRDATVMDGLADVAGAVVGVAGYLALGRKRVEVPAA